MSARWRCWSTRVEHPPVCDIARAPARYVRPGKDQGELRARRMSLKRDAGGWRSQLWIGLANTRGRTGTEDAMPYVKVGQESSGPIGLYDEDHGSGRPWIARR